MFIFIYCNSKRYVSYCLFFFFNDTATTEIYTLSLHDALPIWIQRKYCDYPKNFKEAFAIRIRQTKSEKTICIHNRKVLEDRKSTRLNSSHANISYAVFCLKKKKNKLSQHYIKERQKRMIYKY